MSAQLSLQLIPDKKSDNSIVEIHPDMLSTLLAFRGDPLQLQKGRRKTVLIAISHNHDIDIMKIFVSKCTLRNLRANVGDIVNVSTCNDIPYGRRIKVLPIDDTLQSVTQENIDDMLRTYFVEAYRPVLKGEHFTLFDVEFRVVSVECNNPGPLPCVIVAPDTKIDSIGPPIPRHLIAPTWKVARLFWIGHLKEEESSCPFAILPKDLVRVLQNSWMEMVQNADLDFEPTPTSEPSYCSLS